MTAPRKLCFQVNPPFTEVYLIEEVPKLAREQEKLAAVHPEATVINKE